MKYIFTIIFFILLSFVIGEVSYLLYLNQVDIKPKITYVSSPIAYTYEQMKNSDYFITSINKAKENGVSLNNLAAYFNGANMVNKSMVQSYVISVTAKGRIENISISSDRAAITIQSNENPSEKVSFIYHSDMLSKIEFSPKTLKLADLKIGDSVLITDSVEMKTNKTIKAVITK